MIYFSSDYTEGAHPRILAKLAASNLEQSPGYGTDEHCTHAAVLIRTACHNEHLAVHFLVGGTQANLTVIAAALRPHQGVIAAQTGHIATHESGAIEAAGHKVLTLPHRDGKITAAQITAIVDEHWNDANHEHTVQPGMVYISQPTEYGTLYSKEELTAISRVCRAKNMLLYIDGARLGYGLAAPGNDVTLPDLAELADAFTIGGTKVGALFGEAIVISCHQLKTDFRYLIKQRGGMLAKGRLLGIQFETLFTDNLYETISAHAIRQAMRIKDALTSRGCGFLINSPTNQQFPILSDDELDRLSESFAFTWWERVDSTHSAVRFCTSWATRDEDVDCLVERLRRV